MIEALLIAVTLVHERVTALTVGWHRAIHMGMCGSQGTGGTCSGYVGVMAAETLDHIP